MRIQVSGAAPAAGAASLRRAAGAESSAGAGPCAARRCRAAPPGVEGRVAEGARAGAEGLQRRGQKGGLPRRGHDGQALRLASGLAPTLSPPPPRRRAAPPRDMPAGQGACPCRLRVCPLPSGSLWPPGSARPYGRLAPASAPCQAVPCGRPCLAGGQCGRACQPGTEGGATLRAGSRSTRQGDPASACRAFGDRPTLTSPRRPSCAPGSARSWPCGGPLSRPARRRLRHAAMPIHPATRPSARCTRRHWGTR